jgi:hypothetical protein
MSARTSILALAAVTALAGCGDSGKVDVAVAERRDITWGERLACEVRGTVRNNDEAELRRIEFDLTAGERRSIDGVASSIPVKGQDQFVARFTGTSCGNLPSRLGIEVKRCYFRGDRDCSTAVTLRQ